MNKTIEERFWSRVDVSLEGFCWPWRTRIVTGDYGRFSIKQPDRFHLEGRPDLTVRLPVCQKCAQDKGLTAKAKGS